MAVYTIVKEDVSSVAPDKLFKAMVLEPHRVLVKAQPHVFKSSEIIQGDGGVGTVTKTTFVEGQPFKYMLVRIDELDAANYYCKYTLFEGDALGDNLEKVVYETKMEPEGTGCKGKRIIHFHPKPGCSVNEEEINAREEQAHALFQQVEEYLRTHPDVLA